MEESFWQVLETTYQRIKEEEWKGAKMLPPEDLPELSWQSDQVYLLFKLRTYVRKLSYSLWTEEHFIGLNNEADFSSLRSIVAHRQQEIKEVPRLAAYLKLQGLLERKPQQPVKVLEVLNYLMTFRDAIPVEDYVDIAGFLGNYATYAHNQGWGGFSLVEFRCRVQVVDGRYGKTWKRGDRSLHRLIFSNLVAAALDLTDTLPWHQVPMDLIPTTTQPRTVYQWIELFLLNYASRLAKELRAPTVAYLRTRSAWYAKDYLLAAKYLRKTAKKPLEIYGLSLRRLQLMVYYELMFNHEVSNPAEARKLVPDPRAMLERMQAHLKDLAGRQDRDTYHVEHFTTFSNSYTRLLKIRTEAGKYGENSPRRLKYLGENVPGAIDEIRDYANFSGVWLRQKFRALT